MARRKKKKHRKANSPNPAPRKTEKKRPQIGKRLYQWLRNLRAKARNSPQPRRSRKAERICKAVRARLAGHN